jgi:hypothetical protein
MVELSEQTIITVHDESRRHVCFRLQDGKVASYEHIEGNYPPESLVIWDSEEEWRSNVEGIDWIQEGLVDHDKN